MLLETVSQPWRLVRTLNQTSASFVAKLPTFTEPTGDAGTATGAAVMEIGSPANFTQNGLLLLPFGVGSDGNTFSLRVVGWAPGVLLNSSGRTTWYPLLLCELLCTISSTNVGPAAGYNPNGVSDYFAKTIAVTYGNANVSVEAVSPATAGLLASALVDIKGFQKLEVHFSTGSSATSGNALARFL